MKTNESFDSSADNNSETGAETKTDTRKEKDTEPEEEQNLNVELIEAISQTLTTILDDNKNLENYKEIVKNQSKMVFSANTVPNISIKDYLTRIQTYSNIEKSTMILSLIYIDRICEIADLTLTYFNIHRILFAAVLMAIKYNEDNFYDNKFYSEIAGVKLKELKMIEYTFLDLIDFQMFIDDETYEKYQQYLENIEVS